MLAADIVEVDIDAVGTMAGEFGIEAVDVPVIEGGVKARLVNQPCDLLVGPGAADGAAALDLGDLPGDGTDGTGCGGYEDRLTRYQAAYIEQPHLGGHARHTQGAEEGLQWRDLGVDGV